jgi:EmrB/QacA subfamily drug resistance transporter
VSYIARMTDTAQPSRSLAWDPHVGHPHRKQILAISCLSLVIVVIAVSSLNVAIPTILRDLKPSATQLLWIVDAYALVFAGLLLLAGAIGDRFGRKGALLGGLVVFGAGALAASQVSDPNLLIAMRAIMGVGAAFVMPATLSIVTSVFPPAERPKAIATWAGFAGAGGALGPLLGGFMVEHYGWSAVFLVNLPLVVVTLVLVSLRVPSSRDETERRLDVIGAVISVVALGALLFGIIQGPDQGWGSPLVLGSFALAVAAGVVFVLWELRVDEPMLDPRFFRIPAFRAGSAVITSLFFGMFGMFFLITQYLQFVKGYSPLQAGVATLPSAAVLILVTPRSPTFVRLWGARRVVVIGMLLVSAGFALFAMLGPDSPYLMVAAGLVVIATGMGFAMAPASTAIVSSLPMSKAGVASAVNDVTREVGGALGIAVLGTVLTSRFTSLMDQRIPAAAPEQVRVGARSSVSAAIAIADKVPPHFADALRDGARSAFSDAMNTSFVISAVLLLVMAVVASRAVPRDMQANVGH